MQRDYELAMRLSKAGDDLMLNTAEAAAVCGLSRTTVQQRRVKGFPAPRPGVRKLLWRLGDLRDWMKQPGKRNG